MDSDNGGGLVPDNHVSRQSSLDSSSPASSDVTEMPSDLSDFGRTPSQSDEHSCPSPTASSDGLSNDVATAAENEMTVELDETMDQTLIRSFLPSSSGTADEGTDSDDEQNRNEAPDLHWGNISPTTSDVTGNLSPHYRDPDYFEEVHARPVARERRVEDAGAAMTPEDVHLARLSLGSSPPYEQGPPRPVQVAVVARRRETRSSSCLRPRLSSGLSDEAATSQSRGRVTEEEEEESGRRMSVSVEDGEVMTTHHSPTEARQRGAEVRIEVSDTTTNFAVTHLHIQLSPSRKRSGGNSSPNTDDGEGSSLSVSLSVRHGEEEGVSPSKRQKK